MGYEWLSIPLTILAVAFLYHGFPSLVTINKHYEKSKEEPK
jgi:hypothetical protein